MGAATDPPVAAHLSRTRLAVAPHLNERYLGAVRGEYGRGGNRAARVIGPIDRGNRPGGASTGIKVVIGHDIGRVGRARGAGRVNHKVGATGAGGAEGKLGRVRVRLHPGRRRR